MQTALKEHIVDILSSKIRFAAGADKQDNLAAFCPFHKGGSERKPSMYVYVGPTKSDRQVTGSAFCHTCQKGWGFSGLMRALDIRRSYVDSVCQIIDEQKPPKQDMLSRANFELPRVPEVVLGAFEHAPKSLLDAGFLKETLREFDVGFDYERKRITFPLRDHLGNLVGISGRSVVGEYPRYKIYKDEFKEVVPNYELKKNRVLWGLDRFYHSVMLAERRQDNPTIVCEGFKAAMWVAQSGYPNVVALLGVHCSDEQQILLSRVSNEVVILLDNDEAGRKAAWAVSRKLSGSLTTYLGQYPERPGAASPDDLTPTELKSTIQNSKSRLQRRIYNG